MPVKAKERQEAEKGYRMAFKYRIYPTADQEEYLQLNFDATRFVYNVFLRKRIDAYERTRKTLRKPVTNDDGEFVRDESGKVVYADVENEGYDPEAKPLSFYDTSRMLTSFKRECLNSDGEAWLAKADATALVYALRNLESAYQGFFRRVKSGGSAKFPKFKRRQGRQSFKIAGRGARIAHEENDRFARFTIPKLKDPIKLRYHREIEGEIVSCTIERTPAGKYYASFSVKGVERKALPEREDEIGIALGITPWVVTSDGEVVENPRHRKVLQKRLARAQRKLARRQGAKKGEEKSKRFLKQKSRVERIEEKIAEQRRDSTHKLTHMLVSEHGVIITRDMASSSMLCDAEKKSWKLRQSIADANFAEINRQLAYKGEWAGRTVVIVPSDFPTAQVCSKCGHKETVLAKDLRATWTCPECGCRHDRKANGAANVLAAGCDILAGGERAYVTRDAMTTRKKRQKGERKGELQPLPIYDSTSRT